MAIHIETNQQAMSAQQDNGSTSGSGFSLLELLIVVAIILIIATIAIPSLIRSRQSANESAGVAAVRLIMTAQTTYSLSNEGNFSGSLVALVGDDLLDDRFNADPATVGGYAYTMTQSGGLTDFKIDADPVSANTARFNYYSIPDGVIRYDDEADNPLPQGSPVQ